MNSLVQKEDGEIRTFQIIDNGLKIHEKSMFAEMERIVPFESISNEFVKLKFNPIHWIVLLATIFLMIVSGIFLKMYGIEGEGRMYYYVIIFLIGGLTSLIIQKEKEIVLSCYLDRGIEFYKDNPSKSEIEKFIKELFEIRNETLKKKYGLVSEFIPYQDQLEKFNLLHSLGIIDLNELEELKRKLDEEVDKNNEGFNFNLN